eukprot:Nitzschia sp. Nitz4//scaffold75_size92586//81657//84467//NITZ4_004871-RA/size92586-processed-gene-0.30-mRNA-1//1//CDS//3329557753//3359//frame0
MVYAPLSTDEEGEGLQMTEMSPHDDEDDDSFLEDEEDEFDDEDDNDLGDSDHSPAPDISHIRAKFAEGSSRLPNMAFLEEQLLWGAWNRWEEPCLLSVCLTAVLVVPLLVGWSWFVYVLLGRFWAIWAFALHLQFRLTTASWYIKSTTTVSFQYRNLLRLVCSFMTILELGLFIGVYPAVASAVQTNFYTDIDGTWVTDWVSQARFLYLLKWIGWLVVLCRVPIGVGSLVVRAVKWSFPSRREWRPTFMEMESLPDNTHRQLLRSFQLGNGLVFLLNLVCLLSVLSHFGPWPMQFFPEQCDPLDETECALPFPSFFHMQQDDSSETGWKVDLKGLPPLRGGIPFHPKFLNEMDGFSTMAPILFYMDDLKEAYESGEIEQFELQGPERIEYSVTRQSITLLLDVDAGELVPHSAEIDYLDPDRPLVLIVPAKPLNHATHYAVVVSNAEDKHGKTLPPTPGMKALFEDTTSERYQRYTNTILPQLRVSASFLQTMELENVQLLFDFVTASAKCQVGNLRTARDLAMAQLEDSGWDWAHHVSLVKEEVHSCDDESALIARTLHLQIETPWFLRHTNSRHTTLDENLLSDAERKLGTAKALVRIPCGRKHNLKNQTKAVQIKAVLEYGHGLFYHRGEVNEEYLSSLAHRNGYILFAMDWRGMSAFDLPIVIKTLLSKPGLFQSVRDNLIQGYVNKLAFQHFSRQGLLNWLNAHGVLVSTRKGSTPDSVYYGNSQGAILGGGYLSAMANTGLIQRGVLGVPGTPFALVMTRSVDFMGYDALLLLNFYNNRHVRILLSLVQMGWDSVETSGLLAGTSTEPIPRVLLQAGLGDAVVPTIAAEAMTRAMGGATLPHNPRTVFDVPTLAAANATWDGPNVTLTELLYEKEFSSLPLSDEARTNNKVHFCVRHDENLILQLEEFVNTARVIDPCIEDKCRRAKANC